MVAADDIFTNQIILGEEYIFILIYLYLNKMIVVLHAHIGAYKIRSFNFSIINIYIYLSDEISTLIVYCIHNQYITIYK